MFATEYFFFRSTWGPGADSRVRNALLLAIPWTELRSNYLIPAKTLVFPIAGYPQLEGIETQNVTDAKKQLIEANITDPGSLAPLVISIPDSEAFISLAKIIQKAWMDLGFKVEIRATPYESYYGTLRSNDYTIGISTWIGDFADPLSFLELFRPTSSLNDSGWNKPEFEALIQSSSSIVATRDRYAKLAEAEKLLLEDGVIMPIAHNPSLNVIDTNGISGWYANALDIHPFKFIQFTQKMALPGVAMLVN
jgi:oligopeptide transport system substrate-binding protein